jgi:hypothetical protein
MNKFFDIYMDLRKKIRKAYLENEQARSASKEI